MNDKIIVYKDKLQPSPQVIRTEKAYTTEEIKKLIKDNITSFNDALDSYIDAAVNDLALTVSEIEGEYRYLALRKVAKEIQHFLVTAFYEDVMIPVLKSIAMDLENCPDSRRGREYRAIDQF